MCQLTAEVEKFKAWAANQDAPKGGEWECQYENWPALYCAVSSFVESRVFESWNEVELQSVLYAIARDNESEYLSSKLRLSEPGIITKLAAASIRVGECDDRWQLAVELGEIDDKDGAEPLLLAMAGDAHEYVRRRALQSLAKIGSRYVESISITEWHKADDAQQWSRMNALDCLSKVRSPHYEALLDEAERDPREHLREYARGLRRGDAVN